MVVVLKLDSSLEINSFPEVVLVAVQEDHVDIRMKFGNEVIAVFIQFFLDGFQVHGCVNDGVVVWHALAQRVHCHSECLGRPVVFQPLNDVVAKLLLLLIESWGDFGDGPRKGQSEHIAERVLLRVALRFAVVVGGIVTWLIVGQEGDGEVAFVGEEGFPGVGGLWLGGNFFWLLVDMLNLNFIGGLDWLFFDRLFLGVLFLLCLFVFPLRLLLISVKFLPLYLLNKLRDILLNV